MHGDEGRYILGEDEGEVCGEVQENILEDSVGGVENLGKEEAVSGGLKRDQIGRFEMGPAKLSNF